MSEGLKEGTRQTLCCVMCVAAGVINGLFEALRTKGG